MKKLRKLIDFFITVDVAGPGPDTNTDECVNTSYHSPMTVEFSASI